MPLDIQIAWKLPSVKIPEPIFVAVPARLSVAFDDPSDSDDL